MASDAIGSLKRKLNWALKPSELPRLPSRLQVLSLLDKICFFEDFLKLKLPSQSSASETNKCLENEIEEATREADDRIDIPFKEQDGPRFFQILEKVIEKLDSIMEKLKPDNKERTDSTRRVGNILKDKKIVGQLDRDLKMLTLDFVCPSYSGLKVITIFGMAGIGKTTLASIFFDDPFIADFFEIRAWVTISPEDQVGDVAVKLLDCLRNSDKNNCESSDDDDDIEKAVKSILRNERYLIVLDGVWEENAWENYKGLFSRTNNGSYIVLTTQSLGVARCVTLHHKNHDLHEMLLLDESESWDLFCDKVFGREECPEALEENGRKIVRNCRALPLAIITVGEHLAKAEKTPEYWQSVAAESKKTLIYPAGTAFGGLISLKKVLIRLLAPYTFYFLRRLPIISLYHWISSLEDIVVYDLPSQKLSDERKRLGREISEAIYEVKYGIECFKSGWYKGSAPRTLPNVLRKIYSIIGRMADNDGQELQSRESLAISSPRQHVPNPYNDSKIVGLDSDLEKLADDLATWITKTKVIIIFGMAGVGKTTLASMLYHDPLVADFFDIRAWVTISPEDQVRDVVLRLLDCLQGAGGRHDENNKTGYDPSSDANLRKLVYTNLKDKSYLIILDGLWEENAWEHYRGLFPDDLKSGKIILTTQLKGVAKYGGRDQDLDLHEIKLLGESESWDLLHYKVFGKEECPRVLKQHGKRIARNCQGLPLAIIAAGEHLAKAEKTPEYWKSVAESGNSLISSAEEGEPLRKSLSLSYRRLPEHLKPYFVYTGIFRRHFEFSATKLISLWVAEGSLEPNRTISKEDALILLQELVDRSVVLVHRQSSIGGIKTCILHYVMWEICSEEAKREDFFCILNNIPDSELVPEEGNTSGSSIRRLSIHKNVLLGIEDVRNLINKSHSPTICSFLCIGPYHPYPLLQFCFHNFLSLKILDALTIRFYEFPSEILELFQLKYLALTYGGELPRQVCNQLRLLQVLIILRPIIVKNSGAVSHLPVEIWGMQELRHLQVDGGGELPVPDPSSCASSTLSQLPCLSTLFLDVTDPRTCCAKEILEKVPNLEKLGVRIDLTHEQQASFPFFDHIASLLRLQSFKCAIFNPNSRSQVLSMPDQLLQVFPQSLTKLSLSGCGFPWEDMKAVSWLPHLQSLKLRCNAFRGQMWEVTKKEFSSLRFLLLEDLDLVKWKVEHRGIPKLQHLNVSNCYRLERIPDAFKFGRFDHQCIQLIEVDDCDPVLVTSATKMRRTQILFGTKGGTEFRIHCSWDKKWSVGTS